MFGISFKQENNVDEAVADLPETKRLVVAAAINKIFTQNYFDICAFDSVLAVLDGSRETTAYVQLRALHCVHYNTMSNELKQILPKLMNEALKSSQTSFATTQTLRGIKYER